MPPWPKDCLTEKDQCVLIPGARYDRIVRELETVSVERDNLQVMLEMLRDGILVLNRDGVVRYVNAAACGLFQRSPEQLIGYPLGYPVTDQTDPEICVVRPDGRECVVEMRAISGNWYGENVFFVSLRDVSARKRLQLKLEELATHDELTGLYNYRAFYDFLQYEWRRTKRHHHPLSLFMLDIDLFKKVNDTYGHQAGDAILHGLSQLLMKQARETDRICRYGGEEISILMPETRAVDALKIAERLRKSVAAQNFNVGEGTSIGVTISLGVAGYSRCMRAPSELVSAADAALYAAKESGRNCVWCWDNGGIKNGRSRGASISRLHNAQPCAGDKPVP